MFSAKRPLTLYVCDIATRPNNINQITDVRRDQTLQTETEKNLDLETEGQQRGL